MQAKERIIDIFTSGLFNLEEIENTENENTFKSWEFWQILHFTNEEFYYLAEEEIPTLADERIETEKGIFFCFS